MQTFEYDTEEINPDSEAARTRRESTLSEELLSLQSRDAQIISERDTTEEERFLESYTYFDVKSIMDGLHISHSTMKQGRKLIDEGMYDDFEVTAGILSTDPKGLPVGQASMNTDRGGYTLFRFNRKKIIYATCTDWRCRSRRDEESYLGYTLCEHEAALLLLLQEQLKEVNPGDATNHSGYLLMHHAAAGTAAEAKAAVSRQLMLEAYLGKEDNGLLYTGFKIGTGRLYKVKDLVELQKAMAAEGTMTFGKGTQLQMSPALLREQDRPYLELINEAVLEEQCRADYLKPRGMRFGRTYYGDDPLGYDFHIKDKLPLFGQRLDRFFALAEGRRIELQEVTFNTTGGRSTEKRMIDLRDENSSLALAMTVQKDPEDGTFLGICLDGAVPQMIRGGAYTYMLHEDALCRSKDVPMQLMNILEEAADNGLLHILIGRNRLNEFFRRQLPELKKHIHIETSEEDQALIDAYLPPEAELICYLDIDGGDLICTPRAVYGSHVHNILDGKYKADRGILERYRDPYREVELLHVLEPYFTDSDPELGVCFVPAEDEVLYCFLTEGIEKLLEVCEVRSTQRLRRLGIRRMVNLHVGVSLESGLLDLEIDSGELSQEELLDVLDSYRRKQQYVRLRSGDFLKLDDSDMIRELADMMTAMHLSPKEFVKGKMHIPAYRALYLDKMLAESEGIYAQRGKSFKALVKRFKTIADSEFELPDTLSQVLRPYQAVGYRWLRTLDENGFGGILADEMGLGKTLQVISVLLAARQERARQESTEHETSLIVCPASLVYNWAEELQRFAPELKLQLLIGSQKERADKIAQIEGADVVVTSYDLLKRDIDQFEGKTFRFEVIDEAQYIKNHSTAAAKAVKLIRAQTKFALTGTPIENRLSELWSIFDYLMPGFLYEYTSFSRELEKPIVKEHDEDALRRLKRMVSPFILRRLKTDVLKDLPEKLEEVRYAGMNEKQLQLYQAHVTRMKMELAQASEEDVKHNQIQILSELTQLRQICCDPSLLYDNYSDGSAKREACMDLIRGAIEGGHRMLLFSQFTQMLGLLEQELQKAKIPYYIITGKTEKAKRLELVNAFNTGDVPVFLISLKAGGTGLNLTGADTVIHYDPWWNAAAENQATDRAHRIGQTKLVTVFKLIMKDTIEEKILELQEAKRTLADDILSGEGTRSSSLTREELLEILG